MSKTGDVNLRLEELGLKLPQSPADTPYFTVTRRFGEKLLYISGCGPAIAGEPTATGHIPSEVSVEEGRQCARNCALNLIAAIQEAVGDLNNVKAIVKLLVYVSSDPLFDKQHLVAHGASGLFIDVFGECVGKATRSAVGVAALPLGFPVEVEAIVELN